MLTLGSKFNCYVGRRPQYVHKVRRYDRVSPYDGADVRHEDGEQHADDDDDNVEGEDVREAGVHAAHERAEHLHAQHVRDKRVHGDQLEE